MSVLDKVQEIQDAIREQYGVDVEIKIAAHSLTKEKANEISFDIAQNIEPKDIKDYRNDTNNGVYWVSLSTEEDFDFVAFYNGPEKRNPWGFPETEKDAS